LDAVSEATETKLSALPALLRLSEQTSLSVSRVRDNIRKAHDCGYLQQSNMIQLVLLYINARWRTANAHANSHIKQRVPVRNKAMWVPQLRFSVSLSESPLFRMADFGLYAENVTKAGPHVHVPFQH